MRTLSTGLIADGSSDQVLIPLLTTLLGELLPDTGFQPPQWIAPMGKKTLAEKIDHALDTQQFQLDILFVHRDSENETPEKRMLEISKATPPHGPHPIVCVLPVKMTEAWLLTSANVIRKAVGNPHSNVQLQLPQASKIESCDAKSVLFAALTGAAELGTQRRRKFKPESYRLRVAELTNDLSALREIPSFQQLEAALRSLLKQKKIPHAAL